MRLTLIIHQIRFNSNLFIGFGEMSVVNSRMTSMPTPEFFPWWVGNHDFVMGNALEHTTRHVAWNGGIGKL